MTIELQSPPTRRPPAQLSGNITTAVVMATALADDARPAALLPWEGGTVLSRLVAQFGEIGLARVYVITRPEWEDDVRAAAPGATVQASGGIGSDCATVGRIASESSGGLVIALGDLVTHRGALEGLLASPGILTGALGTGGGHGSPFAFRARTARGRMVSASSAYHAVANPRTSFLGVLKIAAEHRDTFVQVAESLAELTADGPPPEWAPELDHKTENWRLSLGRTALKAERRAARDALEAEGRGRDELPRLSAEEYAARRRELARALPSELESEVKLRTEAAKQDVVALLLVGMVRSGVHVGNSFVRRLFWARPLSHARVEQAALNIQNYDEEKVLLNSAVKGTDGTFTTFFVSTWSRYLARWAARLGLKPNQVTVFSLLVGIAAAAAFATGEREGYIAGAVLLYLAFVFDCVDGQLARYTRQFSKFGAWLDSVFDRSKEYIAFAGLGIGAGTPEVWALAGAAITLQTLRHSFDFSYGATDRAAIAETPQPPVAQAPDESLARTRMKIRGSLEPRLGALERTDATAAEIAEAREDADAGDLQEGPKQKRPLARRILGAWRVLDRHIPGLRWIKKMLAFPIGERFAAICVTTAIWDPRTTFIVLLSWGGFALVYTSIGRVLRSIAEWRKT
jgi:hypothetical protein